MLLCSALLWACEDNKVYTDNIPTDLKFKGVSMFTKHASYSGIVRQLREKGIPYYTIEKENTEVYDLFHLPYKCCPEKTVLYLPTYPIGYLSLRDVFLVFQGSQLALVRVENVSDDPAASSLVEFKQFFKKKYVDSLATVVADNAGFDEAFVNRKDSVMVAFGQVHYSDSSYYRGGGSIPVNARYNDVIRKVEDFRGQVAFSRSGIPVLKTGATPVVARSTPMHPAMLYFDTYITTLSITFPNSLQECCEIIEQRNIKANKAAREAYEREVLENL